MTTASKNSILETRLMLDSLCVYRSLLEDPVISRFYSLIGYVSDSMSKPSEISEFLRLYSGFYNTLLSFNSSMDFSTYIIETVIYADNPFTAQAAVNGASGLEVQDTAIINDLLALQKAAALSPGEIKEAYIKNTGAKGIFEAAVSRLPHWNNTGLAASSFSDTSHKPARDLGEILASSGNWANCLGALKTFHKLYGCSDFARFKAFIWQRINGAGKLVPVNNPDPVTLKDLIDYETERFEVVKNTEQFLDGYPANNVLLYGDRGTGKSSTVKAILNEYYSRGLRVIEVPKNLLADFPEIVSGLSCRPNKFILFVDDLAFEDNEENYTALKAVLEGSLEMKPSNVLIYATSNRRHLIKEKFSDRAGLQYGDRDDEVRAYDTMQEKLSLSDRFGITVVFSSPDKQRYLHIIEELAQRNGISMDKDQLHREALKWELWYNGRSPRTARQFITWLKGSERKV